MNRSTVISNDVHKLMNNLGIYVRSHVQGYQVYPGHPFHMEIWMVPGVDLDRFWKEDIFQANNDIKTSFIRPAGKKEVTVSIKGIIFNISASPNTMDIRYVQ